MSQNVRSGSRRPRNPGPVSAVLQASLFDEYTISVLHFDGANGSTTIVDETGRVWLVGGNAQLNTTRSKFGGSSLLSDGSGDYIYGDGSSDYAFGTGNFTIDFWICTSVATTNKILYDSRPAVNGLYPAISIDAAGKIVYYVDSGIRIQGTTTLDANRWYHIAVTRSGTNTRLFVNGMQEGATFTDTYNYINAANRPIVMNGYDGTYSVNGRMDELRISKGIARWTANFIPPGFPYGGTSKVDDVFTKALLHFDGSDGSVDILDETGHIWAPYGSAQIDTGQSVFGGSSLQLGGNNIMLLLYEPNSHSQFQFGTGDFTIDFRFRLGALQSAGLIYVLYDGRAFNQAGLYPTIYINGGATNNLIYFTNSDNRIVGSTSLAINQWYHLALVRSGTTTKMYLNGVQEGSSYSDSNNYINADYRPMIGAAGNTDGTTSGFNGWFDEIRISKGIARWTANFTPPTLPY